MTNPYFILVGLILDHRATSTNSLVQQALRRGDLHLPIRALDAIDRELRVLHTHPYTCRKTGADPHEPELIIPFGGAGFVALFRILSEHDIAVMALRHEREDDYH